MSVCVRLLIFPYRPAVVSVGLRVRTPISTVTAVRGIVILTVAAARRPIVRRPIPLMASHATVVTFRRCRSRIPTLMVVQSRRRVQVVVKSLMISVKIRLSVTPSVRPIVFLRSATVRYLAQAVAEQPSPEVKRLISRNHPIVIRRRDPVDS